MQSLNWAFIRKNIGRILKSITEKEKETSSEIHLEEVLKILGNKTTIDLIRKVWKDLFKTDLKETYPGIGTSLAMLKLFQRAKKEGLLGLLLEKLLKTETLEEKEPPQKIENTIGQKAENTISRIIKITDPCLSCGATEVSKDSCQNIFCIYCGNTRSIILNERKKA